MVKLGKPKVFNTKVKTAHGTAGIVEDRYNFLKKNVETEDLDKAVLKNLKQRLKKEGKFYVSVSYWVDQIYSTNFQLIEHPSDLNLDMFDNDMFVDYNETDVLDEDTRVKMMSVFTAPAGKHSSTGKCGKHNDCLYWCLIQAFNELPKVLTTASRFKKWVGVDRDEGIDIEKIPRIEKKLKLNVHVSGSYPYVSPGKYPRDIRIRLWNGHFSYKEVKTLEEYIELKRGYDERKGRPYPCLFKKNEAAGTVKLCYLSGYREGAKVILEEPISYLSKFDEIHGRNLFLRHVERMPKIEDGKKTWYLPEPEDAIDDKILEYIQFQRCAYQMLGKNALKTLNPIHCRGNYRALACHFFYKNAPKSISLCDNYVYNDEPLKNEEYWLKCAMTGGLVYAQPIMLGTGYEADINSMYPWLMKLCDFITRKGKFKTIDEIPDYEDKYQYAIFRCKITGYDSRLFQRNRHDFYTGLDVKIAQEEGYEVQLKNDGFPNMLWYTKLCRIPGEEVFGTFVDDMYKMKANGVDGAKQVINVLWGYLCSRSVTQVNTFEEDPDIGDMSLLKTMHIRHKDGKKQHYVIKKYNMYDVQNDPRIKMKLFRFKYARFGCFMTALGRHKMYETINPIKAFVYRIHTDGFISSKPLDIDAGTELGEWKLKQGPCEVINANKVLWT